jgi:sulfur carrier protein ThiS
MKITVKLVGVFCLGKFKYKVQEYPSGTKAVDVIEHLQLSKDVLGIILINGVHADEQEILKDGDTLSILPMLDGG